MKHQALIVNLSPAARQVVTFALVGGAATGTHVVAALAAHEIGGLAPLSANFVGYTSAVMVSYLGNAYLTFKRPALHGPQFIKFIVVSLMALALNQLIVYYCTHIMDWRFAWALIPTVVLVPLFTFIMSRLWAFADPENPTSR